MWLNRQGPKYFANLQSFKTFRFYIKLIGSGALTVKMLDLGLPRIYLFLVLSGGLTQPELK